MNQSRSRMLVLGYRGTLEPLAGDADAVEFPPAMEELLRPWLDKATFELARRVPAAHRVFEGGQIPLDELLLLLKHHLAGILTHAVADGQQPADVLRNCPALLPLLRSTVAEWTAAVATFLARLHRDAAFLATALGVRQLQPIEAISGTASDLHAGAHPVLRIAFAGGGCLYMKPRPVTGEWLWHLLLESLERCARSSGPELRLPRARVLTPDSRFRYGWLEPLAFGSTEPLAFGWTEPLTAPADRLRDQGDAYWHAAGAMVCLAQHLRMTDLHLGNVVATGSGPAVTDAECLATPEIATPELTDGKPGSTIAAAIAHAMQAILDTGLLPAKHHKPQPDISGLFGHAAPARGVTLPQWVRTADNSVRLQASAAALLAHPNGVADTSPLAVLPQLLAGYRHAAEVLMHARSTLTQPGAPWRRVLEQAHAPRVIVRDTLTYGHLLSESLLPHHLRSGDQRRSALLLALAANPPFQLPARSASVLRSEARALLNGHIPRLISPPGSRTLAKSSGRPLVRRFTARSAAASVLVELDQLSPARLEQILIPALLTSLW